jgi:hypothetical protein
VLLLFNRNLDASPPPPSGPATLREALYARLAAVEDLATLAGGRIYFNSRPQIASGASFPAAVHSISARSFDHDLAGPNGLSTATWRVDCWAKTELAAAAMADAVRAAFDGFSGVIGQVVVLGCFLEDEADLPEFPRHGTDSYTYRVALSFTVIHRV